MAAKRSALTGAFAVLAWITITVGAIAIVSLVGVLAWQVIGRYVLNDSPSWTEPVALTLMSISALFGAAMLDGAVRNNLKKLLAKRLDNPHVPGGRLHGPLAGC